MIEGADVEELERVARRLSAGASGLRAAEAQLSAEVRRVDWRGMRSAAFKTSWQAVYAPELRRGAAVLETSARVLLAQATAQRIASEPAAPSGATATGGSRPSPEPPVTSIVTDTVWLSIMGVEGDAELTMQDRGDGTSAGVVRLRGGFGTGLGVGAFSRAWDERSDEIVGAFGGVAGSGGQYLEFHITMPTSEARRFLENPDRSLALGLADVAADRNIDSAASIGGRILDGLVGLPLVSHLPGVERAEASLRLADDALRVGKDAWIAEADGPGAPSSFALEEVRQGSMVAASALFAIGSIPYSGWESLRIEPDARAGLRTNPSVRGASSGSFDYSTGLGGDRRMTYTVSVEGATMTPPIMQRHGVAPVLGGRTTTEVVASDERLEVTITTVHNDVATVEAATLGDATTPQAVRVIEAMRSGDEAAVQRTLAELDGVATHARPLRYAVTEKRGEERAVEVGIGYGQGASHTRWELIEE